MGQQRNRLTRLEVLEQALPERIKQEKVTRSLLGVAARRRSKEVQRIARRDHAAAALARRITETLIEAGPLTPEQNAELAAIFGVKAGTKPKAEPDPDQGAEA